MRPGASSTERDVEVTICHGGGLFGHVWATRLLSAGAFGIVLSRRRRSTSVLYFAHFQNDSRINLPWIDKTDNKKISSNGRMLSSNAANNGCHG